MFTRRLTLVALLICTAIAPAQLAGTRLRGESDSGRTRKRLTEAQQKLADGNPTAADELQDILDQSGDDLVLVKDNQYQAARRLVQQSLAALPGKQLATFRDRLEEPAKKLLDAGKKARDPKPLRELVDRYFVSRPAEEGLLLLGELAFERGDFVAAERYWRAVLPGDGDGELRYPQPKADPAGVKAKLILSRAMRGDKDGAAADLERFKKDYPKAAGQLAGTTGPFADTLAKLLPTAAPPPPANPAGWTGFAGGPTRDGRPPADLPRYWPSRPTWVAPIPQEGAKEKPKPGSVPAAKTLAYHPVVLNGSAYIADAGRVFQFDLKTGTARLAFSGTAALEFDAADLALPAGSEADFTLTAADGKLFARLGKPDLPTGNDTDKKPRTFLVCLEPKPDAAKLPADEATLRLKWQLAPPTARDVYAAWEGAPLVADGRVYAAFVRAENNRLAHAIACYPVGGGSPLWVAEVCDDDPRPTPKYRHEVLTLAGANVVFCSHAGVTVAVSAATGKSAWAFRTPSPDHPPPTSPRDLCPPVYHDGRVFVAPADGDAVFALDADSGRLLWSSPPDTQVENLLGVSQGRLIVTTHGKWNPTTNRMERFTGLRGYDVATGSDKGPLGWQQHEDPKLSNTGRGIAGENLILYPTRGELGDQLLILDAATGRRARPTNATAPGNMAVADGVVLVATATEVWGYVFDGDSPVTPPPRGYPLVGVKDPPAFDPKAKVAAAPTAFDPETAPGLKAPAEERKATDLPPLARPLVPLAPNPDAPLVLCDGKRLFAHDPDTGKPLWETTLETPAVLKQVAATTDGRVVAVGESAVAAADAKTGKLAWQFTVPKADPTPALSEFLFAGNRLVAKLGPRGMIALDLGSGKVAWVRDAANEPAVWPYSIDTAPKFGPHMGVIGKSLFVQFGGECWEVDASTGESMTRYPSTSAAWTGRPLEYKGKVLLPADGGLVLPSPVLGSVLGSAAIELTAAPVLPRGLVIASGGKSERLFDPGRPASRTAPPAVRAFQDALFVLVPRNIGDELQVLKANATRSRPLLLPNGVDLMAADTDGERVYLQAEEVLVAVALETSREEWRAPLPELPAGVRWTVRAGRTSVIVCPTEAIADEPWDAGRELSRLLSHPTSLRLIGTTLGMADAARFTFPVLLIDSATGKLAQRIDLPAFGPPAAVIPRPDSLLVATTGRAVWLGKK